MSMTRVAVVEAAPAAFDRDRTIEKIRDRTVDAACGGAALVLFPEAFVSAYPKGLDFGARVGSCMPAGRRASRGHHESALDVSGSACTALGTAAHQPGLCLAIGGIERKDGTL